MTRMADQEQVMTREPLLSAADVLSFPPRPLPVGSSAEQVLSKLYATWYDRLVQYATDRVSRDDAEDVVQLAFVEIWDRYLAQGNEPSDPYERVLFAAVRFRVFDFRRTVRRRRFLISKYFYIGELLDVARRWMKPEARLEVKALARAVDDAIRKLPPRMRELQVLYRRSGFDVTAICTVTDLAPTTVRDMLGKGNRIIAEHLDRAGYSPASRRALEKKGTTND